MGERACRAGRKRLRACSLPRTSGRPSITFASSAASSAFLPCGAKRGRRSTRAWVCACCGDGSREARSGWFWLGLGWFCEEDVCAALACLFTRPVSAPAARTRVTEDPRRLHLHARAVAGVHPARTSAGRAVSPLSSTPAQPCPRARRASAASASHRPWPARVSGTSRAWLLLLTRAVKRWEDRQARVAEVHSPTFTTGVPHSSLLRRREKLQQMTAALAPLYLLQTQSR